MESPGILNLGDFNVGAAATQTGDPVTGLEGMTAVTIQARLFWGSGGTKTTVYIQTSLDQGVTWVDIACFTFGLASAGKIYNLSGLTPKTTEVTPTDGALADDTSVDGILGDRLRAKVINTGTYASTTCSLRVSAR